MSTQRIACTSGSPTQELLDKVSTPCSMLSRVGARGASVSALPSRKVRSATSPGTRQYLRPRPQEALLVAHRSGLLRSALSRRLRANAREPHVDLGDMADLASLTCRTAAVQRAMSWPACDCTRFPPPWSDRDPALRAARARWGMTSRPRATKTALVTPAVRRQELASSGSSRARAGFARRCLFVGSRLRHQGRCL